MSESMSGGFENKRIYAFGEKDMPDSDEGFSITINLSSSEPIYRQISGSIVRSIATGVLKAGTRLPPSRQLSSILGVNYHTVNKAYSFLESQEYIYMDRRKHIFISTIKQRREKDMGILWENRMKNLLTESISKGFSPLQIEEKIVELLKEIATQEE